MKGKPEVIEHAVNQNSLIETCSAGVYALVSYLGGDDASFSPLSGYVSFN